MPIKKDYSEWLSVDDRLATEERLWAETNNNLLMAHTVKSVCMEYPEIKTVQEFGCGTGWVPYHLPIELEYCGMDKNAGCLELAAKKNPYRDFVLCDIREFTPSHVDLVITLSFLKHFELEEWDNIFNKILTSGSHACFSMNINDIDEDDGIDFPHTWITLNHLHEQITKAGHVLRSQECFWENGSRRECIFTTSKK